jgi:O-antigen/teichoic acid export membrane protein
MMKQFIAEHLGSRQSLRRKTISGSSWLFGKTAVLSAFDLAKTMIFARILDAYAYGIMALSTMAVSFLESFTTLGLDIIIQRDDNDYKNKLGHYWALKAVRGCTLFCFTWIFAAPFAGFFDRPELVPIIRFMSLSFLFDGFAGFGKEVTFRTMAFARNTRYEIVSSFMVTGASIVVLFAYRNVWALAAYVVLGSFSRMVVSYLLFPWRPCVRFDRKILKTVIMFSGSIIAMNALNCIFNNVDKAIIGKLLDIEQLGYYARANFLALLPSMYLAVTISPVFLPSFKNIADDAVRLRKAFLKVFALYLLLFSLLGLGLFVFARPFVLLLYGSQWLAVVPLFQIMLLYGVAKSITSVCPTIFYLKAKPWYITASTLVLVASFCTLCIPMIRAYGLAGIAWALVIAGLLSNGLLAICTFKVLWFDRGEAGKAEKGP